MGTFLPPIEKPKGLILKLACYFTRRQFGEVLTPLKVHSARLPPAFGLFYAKIGKLDKKLLLPPETAPLIREPGGDACGSERLHPALRGAVLSDHSLGHSARAAGRHGAGREAVGGQPLGAIPRAIPECDSVRGKTSAWVGKEGSEESACAQEGPASQSLDVRLQPPAEPAAVEGFAAGRGRCPRRHSAFGR